MLGMGTTKDTVIVDLDGTLACDKHRNHLISGPPGTRKWDEYFSLCGGDAPRPAIIRLVRSLHDSYFRIAIFTGRCASTESVTRRWLAEHSVPYDFLRMRDLQDRTDDHILKPSWADHVGGKDRILLVLEDRKRVVSAWRNLGYDCLQVNDGDF